MHTTDGIVYYSAVTEPGSERKLAMRMLKQGFAEFFDMEFSEELIKRNGYGKPYYHGAGEQIQFNLSHCRNALAVAVSHRRVGVDVEGMRSVNYRTAIKCCSREEYSYVLGWDADLAPIALQMYDAKKESGLYLPKNHMSEEAVKRFLQLWTLKESYVKMTGEGLRKKINEVNFALTDTQGIWKREVQAVMSSQKDSRHFLYSPGEFVLALTAEYPEGMGQAEFIWKEYNGAKLEERVV